MATEVFINIKDLPELTQPNNGDYIIIETSTGTHLLDFKNLVIPTTNTVITTTVEQNSTAILTNATNINAVSSVNTTLSTTVAQNTVSIQDNTSNISTLSTTAAELSAKISGNVNSDISSLSSSNSSLDARITSLSAKVLSLVYIGKSQISIASGSKQATGTITPTPSFTLSNSDILITPANAYATQYPVHVSLIDGSSITIESGSVSAATDAAMYSLMAIKSF